MQKSLIHSAIAVGAFSVVGSASAFDIQLDFGANAFFAGNATARAAVEAAATDLETAITTKLGAFADMSAGTSGSTTVTFDFERTYPNPNGAGNITLANASIALDAFPVFVGTEVLGGTTLGQGGPSFSFGAGVSGFPAEAQAASNIASAGATANA